MNRKTIAALALGLLAALSPGAAEAQTADELIEKNIQAKGGREKLKAVQTLRLTGKMTVGPGADAPFTLEMKRPNKGRIEFQFQGMTGVQAYDGTTGWSLMPFLGKKDAEVMSAEDLKQVEDQFDLEGPLMDYKAKGHQVELLGKEDLEGTPAYKLKLTKKNGEVSTVFLDAEYFLELREEAKRTMRGQEMETVSTYGDYKPVDGMVFAHSFNVQVKGAPVPPQVMTIEKVEVNPEVPDARFTMPKPEAPPAAKPPGAS
jgi:outer membrane lipoprotein-sorting protein